MRFIGITRAASPCPFPSCTTSRSDIMSAKAPRFGPGCSAAARRVCSAEHVRRQREEGNGAALVPGVVFHQGRGMIVINQLRNLHTIARKACGWAAGGGVTLTGACMFFLWRIYLEHGTFRPIRNKQLPILASGPNGLFSFHSAPIMRVTRAGQPRSINLHVPACSHSAALRPMTRRWPPSGKLCPSIAGA